jgi:hypothetical protein
MRAGGTVLVALAIAAIAVGCGEDEGKTYSNKQIIEKLNLEKSENGYTIDGDLFCEVEGKLLNDSEEVSSAAERDDLGLVIASREGNVGVKAVPVFAPDCKDKAVKKLNRLDPKPKEDGG